MRYRSLAAFPFALALLLVLAGSSVGDRMAVVLTLANEGTKVLVVLGCLGAALAFERGEYLHRVWIIYGTCYLLLLANDGLAVAGAAGPWLAPLEGLVVLAANVTSVVATWMLARAWSVAGLDEDDGALRRRAVFAAAAVASLAVTGWPLVHDARSLLDGDVSALVPLASDLGDVATLALIAPLAHTALAMSGGLLRWPWSFLTASGVAWVAYDLTSSFVGLNHVRPGAILLASESMRVLANGFVFSAALSHRLTIAHDAQLAPVP